MTCSSENSCGRVFLFDKPFKIIHVPCLQKSLHPLHGYEKWSLNIGYVKRSYKHKVF
jgi:hypothetical protein